MTTETTSTRTTSHPRNQPTALLCVISRMTSWDTPLHGPPWFDHRQFHWFLTYGRKSRSIWG